MYEFIQNLMRYGLEYYSKYYGSYRGVVMDNNDPSVLGRLLVKIPALHDEDYPEYWAPSKGMPTGLQMALWAIPPVGSVVWVSFENGDARFPIWEYGPFVQKSQVPDAARQDNFFFQTPKGQRIQIDDAAGTITVINQAKAKIILGSDSRINVSNDTENLKDVLKETITEIIQMTVITPAGEGFVGPDSMQALLQLQVRLLKLLS